jgi:hypothetical protein
MRAKGLFFGKIIGFAILIVVAMPMLSFAEGKNPTEHLVHVYDRGGEKTIVTNALTVRQALQAARISIDEKRAKAAGLVLYREDKVDFMSSDNLLVDGASLVMKIERAKQRTVTEEVDIDFEIEQVKDDSQPIGFKSIKQLGEKGVRKMTYQVEANNGVEVSRKELSGEIIKQPKKQIEVIGTKPKNPLTKGKGAQIFTDSKGVAHRETYYDLPMNIVANACGGGGYTVRADGAKVDKDGYILVAANYGNYPRCSVVETSMGPGKVYDTGGFAARHPHGFDLATDWTNGDGR